MKLMLVGMGLIGGSMAMALQGYPGLELYAIARRETVRADALRQGLLSAAWPEAQSAPLESMDLVILCLPPEACIDFVRHHASRLREGALLSDVCGVKQPLCRAIQDLPERRFFYLGGHPMAGREQGGFSNATRDLFRGAHYILVPQEDTPESAIQLLTSLATYMGCCDVVRTTAQAHDERIAYTSQLMHVLALALCDQHLLFDSYGFEGGSFRGATRVAGLDPELWCELFDANRQALSQQISELRQRLGEYETLLETGDRDALLSRLTASSQRKKEFNRLRGLDPKAPLFK